MTDIIHIPEMFEQIVEEVSNHFEALPDNPYNVFFDYGHYVEVTRSLTQKDGSISFKDKKYPLVWLVMDFRERYGDISEYEYCQLPDLQIIIAVPTSPQLTTRQRVELNFKPTLYPIYQELLFQIADSGFFSNADPLIHEKIDRPYWGGQDSQGNGTANLFNDFIDAIQLKNIKLNVNNIC